MEGKVGVKKRPPASEVWKENQKLRKALKGALDAACGDLGCTPGHCVFPSSCCWKGRAETLLSRRAGQVSHPKAGGH
jgi:hypothetical protein